MGLQADGDAHASHGWSRLPKNGGRYWDRTSDLFRVREARYRCANRPGPRMVLAGWRWIRDSNPCRRLCRPLPRLSANPPCSVIPVHPKKIGLSADDLRADDEIRTRDPHLGKVMRYHCATSATAHISACLEDSTASWRAPCTQVSMTRRPGRLRTGQTAPVVGFGRRPRTTPSTIIPIPSTRCSQLSATFSGTKLIGAS